MEDEAAALMEDKQFAKEKGSHSVNGRHSVNGEEEREWKTA